MNNLELARQYFDAWNNHDAEAIVSTLEASGTYQDPTSELISGQEIGTYAKGLNVGKV